MEIEKSIILSVMTAGILGLAYSFWQSYKVNKLEPGNQKMSDAAASIKSGVITYITTEYKFLLLFVLSLGIILFFHGKSQAHSNGFVAASLVIGAASSAIAGYFSIRIAATNNVKVTNESQKSFGEAFTTAFSASTSIGLIGVSSVILGLGILLTGFGLLKIQWEFVTLLNVIAGFSLGTSSVSLFARMGGGIFAKSADLAEGEIVKTEPGITKKSLYNPASIANEAGQSISNVGGIGADIFESFAAAIIACMLLGASLLTEIETKTASLIALPLIIASIGIFSSIGGSFLLRSSEVSTTRKAMNIAEGFAAIILSAAVFFSVKYLLPGEWDVSTKTDEELIITTYKGLGVFWSAFFGIAASIAIGYISNIYTGKESKTIKNIVSKSSNGAANNVLGGIEAGLFSTGLPLVLIIAVAIGAHYFSGFYGIGIATVGYLGNTGLQLAFNAYAPITDNSNSIAIKAGLDEQTIQQTNDLKLIGIQSIVRGKVFLVFGASLASLALLGAFIQLTGLHEINLTKPLVIAALLVGALLPVLLSSNALAAVSRLSKKIINEVGRQFTDISELGDAKEILDKYNGDLTYATEGEKEIIYSAQDSADYNQCIEISAYASIWETLIPGTIAITIPVLVAYLGGAEILAGLLIGTIASGILLAVYQANIGSALENTKYALEEGVVQNGELMGADSAAYKSALIGEKIGKPIKDAASPAVTVLMKLMLIISIILIPLLANKSKKSKALHVENTSIIIKHSIESNPKQTANSAYNYYSNLH